MKVWPSVTKFFPRLRTLRVSICHIPSNLAGRRQTKKRQGFKLLRIVWWSCLGATPISSCYASMCKGSGFFPTRYSLARILVVSWVYQLWSTLTGINCWRILNMPQRRSTSLLSRAFTGFLVALYFCKTPCPRTGLEPTHTVWDSIICIKPVHCMMVAWMKVGKPCCIQSLRVISSPGVNFRIGSAS